MPAPVEALLFVAYSVIAAGMALHAGLAAASSKHSGSAFTRVTIALLAILLLPVFGLAAIAHQSGNGALELLYLVLPALSAACAIANARLFSHVGFGGFVLVGTTVIWNAALTWIFCVRALAELYAFELGSASTLTLATTSLAQETVGASGAAALPIWLWLPILVSPRYDTRGGMASRVFGGFASTSLAGLLGLAVLPALVLVRSTDSRPERMAKTSPRGDIVTSLRIGGAAWNEGIRLPDAIREISASTLEHDLERAKELGVGEIEFAYRADLADDGTRMSRIQDAVRAARRAGMKIAVRCVAPPGGAVPMHPRRFAERMQHAHWILTERLEPDTLILFDRPYGEETRACLGTLGAKRWTEIVQKAVLQMADGKPRQRCAIALTPPKPKARELWVALANGRGPHEVRFWIEGNRFQGEGAARACIALSGWLAENPSRFAVAISASPPTPLTFGLHATEVYYDRLTALASNQRSVSTLVLGPLRNGSEGLNGLWTSRSRTRPIVGWLTERLKTLGTARSAPR